ncbi:MAG: ATP synthase subunit I [Caldilineaceae bacterium]
MTNFMNWLWWMVIFGAGFGIGVFFFGGLWLTVNRLTAAAHPGALFLVSFYVRILVSMAGIYLLTGQHFENALISMAGFLAARIVIVRLKGKAKQRQEPFQQWEKVAH